MNKLLARAQKADFFIPFVLFFFTCAFYIHNLSQSIFGGDVGDYVSAIAVRGVPHPSGYPLFTILGIGMSFLPLPFTLAGKVGLLSVIFSSLSVVMIYLLTKLLIKNRVLSIVTALSLAFFYLFWLYAEVAEVFALSGFFILLLLFLAFSYYQTKKIKFLYLLALTLGFALFHHEVLILIVPSLFLLVIKTNWKVIFSWKKLLLLLLLFCLGLLPYIYIPIAASAHPLVNWDNATSLSGIIRLILRQDYSWNISQDFDNASRILGIEILMTRTVTELTFAGAILIGLGMIWMITKKYYIPFFAISLGFILFGPVYVVYGFTPILSGFTQGVLERFYLLAAIFLFLFLPFGIDAILTFLQVLFAKIHIPDDRIKSYTVLFSYLFLIVPLSLLRFNFPKTDLHPVWLGDYLAVDMLKSLPKNSLVFLQGDNFFFNTEYVQYALHVRPDIQIFNIGTLGANNELKSNIHRIMKKYPKASQDQIYLQAMQQIAFTNPVFSLVSLQYKDRKLGKVTWIPYGLLFQLVPGEKNNLSEDKFISQTNNYFTNSHLLDILHERDTYPSAHSVTLESVPKTYAQGYANAGNYLISEYNDISGAKDFFEKALVIDPISQVAQVGMSYYFLQNRQCQKAEDLLTQELTLNPTDRRSYYYLYAAYLTCSHDTKKATQLSQKFAAIFHVSLPKDIRDTLQAE